MVIVDTVIGIFSFFWIPKTYTFYFFAAPGDSISITLEAERELDGIYLGKYDQKPILSEVYVKNISWTIRSDTVEPFFLTFLQLGLWERNRFKFKILRFNGDSAYKSFNSRVVFKEKRVYYEDTLWDTVVVMYKKWRIIIPPFSNSFYGALFDGEPVFQNDKYGEYILWIAPTGYDDSLRFLWGDNFLERRDIRFNICKETRRGGGLNVFLLDYEDFRNYNIRPIREIKMVYRGCYGFRLSDGKFGIVVENSTGSLNDITLRLAKVILKPRVIKNYKVIKVPDRVGN